MVSCTISLCCQKVQILWRRKKKITYSSPCSFQQIHTDRFLSNEQKNKRGYGIKIHTESCREKHLLHSEYVYLYFLVAVTGVNGRSEQVFHLWDKFVIHRAMHVPSNRNERKKKKTAHTHTHTDTCGAAVFCFVWFCVDFHWNVQIWELGHFKMYIRKKPKKTPTL